MARITINGNSFDPATALRTALKPADASQSNYILIQTKAALTREQRDQLARSGARILEYVPNDTYIAYYAPKDLVPIQRLPFVTWADVYLHGFKIAPSLTPRPTQEKVKTFGETLGAASDSFSRSLKKVDIVFHVGVSPESVRNEIANAAHVEPGTLQMGRRKVRLTVQERVLPDLAAIDEVRNIEPAPEYQLLNNVARVILGLDSTSSGTGSGSFAYEGDGQVIGIADTGLDKGSTSDVHPAFTGRVARLYSLGRPNKASDPDGHGTHVAGSALGNAQSTILNLHIRGTAPKATLVLQSVLDAGGQLGGLPADLHDLFGPPYNDDGVRVHSNSWGDTTNAGSYTSNSQELDDFVWNNRDCVICFAAGNAGTDADADGVVDPNSVNPPSTAKNCITVGASENNRPDKTITYGQRFSSSNRFPVDPINSDPMADNSEGMAAFSSRGPVANSRNKPDVVAPGTFVLSARSRVTSGKGEGLTADKLFFFESGTSMATPLVAGCAALVREYLADVQQISSPSAALVKAILINGATPMAGQYSPQEVNDPPDISQGFGRVNMPTTVGPFETGTVIVIKDENNQLDTGQRRWYSVPVKAGQSVLKVTLVWTDMPGDALQNDLDLVVLGASGEERGGNGTAPDNPDQSNNVEQVIWNDPPPGRAVIRVHASRITSTPQNYALVIRVQ
jgi:serine protease AprX